MDPRTKAFLTAVAGADGASALIKSTKQIKNLEGLIAPKAIMTWLDLGQDTDFTGVIPGTEIPLRFCKSEAGYTGYTEMAGDIYEFMNQGINHVAAAIAVAIGAMTETDIDHKSLPKLGKSIEILVKHETLSKTSWNVKARRRFQFDPQTNQPVLNSAGEPKGLTAPQVSDRRAAYARSIGLKPTYGVAPGKVFPQSQGGNDLPYNDQFDISHEVGHAAMTPPDMSVAQYQNWLSNDAQDDRTVDVEGEPYNFKEAGLHHENVANATETYVDRRSGVDPHAYQSPYRATMQTLDPSKKGKNALYQGNVKNTKSKFESEHPTSTKLAGMNRGDGQYVGQYGKTPAPNDAIRADAKQNIQQFDDGARFNETGHIVQPTGVDAKINARAKGIKLPGAHLFGKGEPDLAKVQKNPHEGGGGHKSPGPAAAPQAPMQPIAPQLKQPANTKPQMGTSLNDTKAQAKAPKVPGTSAPKLPGMKVTKSEASSNCPACQTPHFKGGQYVGCLCLEGLAKGVATKATTTGYNLTFTSEWGEEELSTLAELFGRF